MLPIIHFPSCNTKPYEPKDGFQHVVNWLEICNAPSRGRNVMYYVIHIVIQLDGIASFSIHHPAQFDRRADTHDSKLFKKQNKKQKNGPVGLKFYKF